MACSTSFAPLGISTRPLVTDTKIRWQSSNLRTRKNLPKYLTVRAVQGTEGPRRLVDIIRIIPDIWRNYFRSRPRRALFGGISLLGGFYVAQTISLSFGALGVNDVIAAVVCVLLTEYVTRFYYSRPKVTFPLALLNNFKMGFTYGLFIDAFKLASWVIILLANVLFFFHSLNHTKKYIVVKKPRILNQVYRMFTNYCLAVQYS